MASRTWTQEDQDISDKKLYFVLTIYIPYATVRRPIKHLFGPAPYHVARRERKRLEEEYKRADLKGGTMVVDMVRWRGALK